MARRYDRQERAIGPAAHERIRAAKVLVVGLGGLGCPASALLVGAGVGRIGLMDLDSVALSNLHRQTLYASADVGRPKVEAARSRLHALNPDVAIASIRRAAKASNADQVVAGWDLVLDCTDSLEARYALSDACAAAGIPLIQGGVAGSEGQLSLLCGRQGPCYRCLHPEAEQGPTCQDEGVLGPLPATVGSLQALWALRLLSGVDAPRPGQLLLLDALGASQAVELKRRADCKAHVQANAPKAGNGNQAAGSGAPIEGPACPMPWNAPQGADIGAQDYAAAREQYFLLDVREPDEHEEYAIPGDTLIPLGELPRRLAEVPKDRPVVVYCAVGGRSARAAALLRDRGYQAFNLRGGIRAWMMAGLA